MKPGHVVFFAAARAWRTTKDYPLTERLGKGANVGIQEPLLGFFRLRKVHRLRLGRTRLDIHKRHIEHQR